MILLIISFIVFWIYVGYTFAKFGVLTSISATINKLKHPIVFTLFELGIALPIVYYIRNTSIGIALGAFLIAGVGVFPSLKIKTSIKQDALHVICATGGILLAYVGMCLELVNWGVFYKDAYFYGVFAFLLSAIIILPIGKFKKPVKNHTTVIEVAAYNIIMILLFIHEIL